MKLSDLKTGEEGIIEHVHGHGAFRKRMMEMGFVPGRHIKALLAAPLKDPVKYSIMGYEVSLRRQEADLVDVKPLHGHDWTKDEKQDIKESKAEPEEKTIITVALIGNPNCGKTSLFNIASGASEHVGNYSGVTVDAKKGYFDHGGYRFEIVDLPGTYSLASYSPEELYVRRYLKDETPDVIINVVDGSNLERNLYLTTELIDMDLPMVIALNMFDELESKGCDLDYKTLGQMIGVPIIPTIARTGQGIDHLFDTVIKVYQDRHEQVRHVHVKLGPALEEAVTPVKDALKASPDAPRKFSPRYLAIKLLEGDQEAQEVIHEAMPEAEAHHIMEVRDQAIAKFEQERPGDDISGAIAGEKYGFIAGALAETMTCSKDQGPDATSVIDTIVTNKLFGFPIFLGVMIFIFWATFQIGSYPMEWMQIAVDWIANTVHTVMHPGPLRDLVSDGIIGGVGAVIVFLPNILILYCCISFMEDSGYMARAAFIMDKLMHAMGLHGKSFIPLVMGFGCTVPSIMAARSIESRSSRIITILINPFISCSARLPIYVLLVGTFFPLHATLVFAGLYLLGVLVAVVTARMLRKGWFKADETPFVMELPPYRVPTTKAIARHTWAKAQEYLRKMGGIILVGSIIVWALNYFPLKQEDASVKGDSYLEMVGKAVTPVMEPIGFHWKATVAAIAGLPAKEIVVSTLGVLYTGDEDFDDATTGSRLRAVNLQTGKPDFTASAALAFMVFILLYCPCIATLTAIVRETHNWGYGAFSVAYNTVVAWCVAFIVFNIAQWCM